MIGFMAMKQMLRVAAIASILATWAYAQAPAPQAPQAPAGRQGQAPGGRGGQPQGPVATPGVASAADPFPNAIPATEGVIRVNVAEFASLPDAAGVAARIMHLVQEPGTRRFFVSDMRGVIYRVTEDGKSVTQYLDLNAAGAPVQAMGRERGFQSFAFHPQFAQQGSRGFGKFYTYIDTTNTMPVADFDPAPGGMDTHHGVLLEWTAKTPGAAAYDGGPARELMRWRDPYQNHNGGMMAFNPLAQAGAPDFGLLYIGVADGGSGGDPLNMSQNLAIGFGKMFRIDPLGNDSRNKQYGIPASNPFVNRPGALPEIYAYGLRNPQRLAWDSRNGNLFASDIGQNIVEEVSIVTAGANLGWNVWEGSYRFLGNQGGVGLENPRSDPTVTYPVVEYGQLDPLLQGQSAAGGLFVYRGNQIPQLANLLVFADMPSGEIFYVNADRLPAGGQAAIRRILLTQNGSTLLQLIQEKNKTQGKMPATRSDLRISMIGPDNRVFLLNKGDGTIRELTR